MEDYVSEKGGIKLKVVHKKQTGRNNIVILSMEIEGKWRQKAQIVVRSAGMPPWAAMLGMKQVAEQTLSSGNTENIKQCRDDVVEAIFSKTWVQYMQNLGLECPKWATTDLIDFVSDRQHLLGGAN